MQPHKPGPRRPLHRQREVEGAPYAELALDPEAAVVGGDEALGDKEAETETGGAAGEAALGAVELFEDAALLLVGHADALVADPYHDVLGPLQLRDGRPGRIQ